MSSESAQDNPTAAVDNRASGSAEVAPEAAAQTFDPLDQSRWEVPVICKDCDKRFELPYRHFHAGVVFRCPHCRGSFVPTVEISRTVRARFEQLFAEVRAAREKSEGDEREAQRVGAFRQELEAIAAAMRPAGKLVKPKGIRAMFT